LLCKKLINLLQPASLPARGFDFAEFRKAKLLDILWRTNFLHRADEPLTLEKIPSSPQPSGNPPKKKFTARSKKSKKKVKEGTRGQKLF
jgi:hypothetical protein